MKSIKLLDGTDWPLNTAYNGDCLEFMKNIPDKSIGLIMADPPYFEVKGEFDFIWPDFQAYLQDVEKWAAECKRILTDNGSIFWWGHAKKIAYSQIILDKYFHLGNSLVWEKAECQTKAQDFETARHFAPVTERCLFYTNETDMTGLEYVEREFVAPRNPFAKELKKARESAGFSIKEIAEHGKFYGNVNHGGAVTNWEKGYNIPSHNQWEKIREILELKNYSEILPEYYGLRAEYEEIRKEFESKRRPFFNPKKLTDVIRHSQESHISRNYDHETIKPLGLIKEMLQTSTRKDTIVFSPFLGSWTDAVACYELGLDWIGCEINKHHFNNGFNRYRTETNQILFDFS